MSTDKDPRTVRLSERFSAIQKSLAEVYDEDKAFAAAAAAWLMAIENSVGFLLDAKEREHITRKDFNTEISNLLQSFHKELCDHLHVDRQDAIDLSTHFHEIVKDLVNEKG